MKRGTERGLAVATLFRTPEGRSLQTSLDLARYLVEDARVVLSPGYSIGFDDLKFRLSFAPIGHRATHEDVMGWEQDALEGVPAIPRLQPARSWLGATRDDPWRDNGHSP